MKTLIKNNAYLLLMALILIFASCNDEDTGTLSSEGIASREAKLVVDAETATNELDALVDAVYANDESNEFNRAEGLNNGLPACVTITAITTATSREVTVDFGEGCEMPNGKFVSGAFTMSYNNNKDEMIRTINVSFNNFSVDGVSITGTHSVVRVKENANGNPQSTFTTNITVSWPNGDSARFEGGRVREWVEGFGNNLWGDNVFLVTGSWTLTTREGLVYKATTTTPLRRESDCRFIVSGIITVERDALSATLDFGDGTCDNKATLTQPNGEVREVNL